MAAVGVILLLIGSGGGIASFIMYGDIGIAALIGSLAAFLSGIGFILAADEIQRQWRVIDRLTDGHDVGNENAASNKEPGASL